MDVLVVADGHYYRDKNNKVYVESVFDYKFYQRYLSAFDNVYAIARMENVDTVPPYCKRADGNNVFFLDIPATRGVKQYFLNYLKTRTLIKNYIKRFDCAIFRVPGVVANLTYEEYIKTGKRFAIEVVVDPWEYFAPGTIQGISRPFVRYEWTRKLKEMCLEATGVSYVTQYYLQKKYPCRAMLEPNNDNYFTSFYSSVELPDDKFGNPRVYEPKDKYIISHVANAFTGYGKGHLTLMQAAKVVIEKGYNIEVWFIGDGPLRKEFEDYAKNIGIENNVKFLGRMPNGDAVREKIKESDIFIFPTKAEGLPRVVLEAMAEGLPVISSPVCGIPEIIENKYLIKFEDYLRYADVIIEVIEDCEDMTRVSDRNIEVSKRYRSSLLTEKRNGFYDKLNKMPYK